MWLINFFSTVKLTLTQWALLSVAAICGGLVVALRLQGSRLHRARIQALHATINATDESEDEKLNILRAKLNKALKEYNRVK